MPGQDDAEGAPFVLHRGNLQAAAVDLDDLLRDVKADAGAGNASRTRVGSAPVPRENLVEFGCRDADSAIDHVDADLAIDGRDDEPDRLARVLERVPDHVVEHVAQAGPVEGFDALMTGGSDYAAIKDADVVIVTAGFPRTPGMSRDDLIGKNAGVIAEVAEEETLHGYTEFEPEPAKLLAELAPRALEAEIFAALLEGTASFFTAQQRAMAAATENADELVRTLTRVMNRARQDAITTEIMEIVGGAEALRHSKGA